MHIASTPTVALRFTRGMRVHSCVARFWHERFSGMFSAMLSISRPREQSGQHTWSILGGDDSGVISRTDSVWHFALHAKRRSVGRENPPLPRRTERRECVESICHGAGHVDTNRQEGSGKKYSHFPRSDERRQGLAMGPGDGNGRARGNGRGARTKGKDKDAWISKGRGMW